MRLVARKMKKPRDRFKRRRQVKRQVVAAVARSARSDPRVFADFNLGGRQMRGLLDSGATVSLLGRGCRELAEELNLPVKPYVSTVRTASGEDRSIIGRLVVPVEYKGEIKDVVLYLCPYLEQSAYLGVDFWRIFGIAPEVVGSEVPVVAAIDEIQGMAEQIAHYVEDDWVKSEPEAWELDESQKSILEEVKAKFLAFEKVGLGKTHAEKHRIELVAGAQPVKDRHYPLSPAMQQVVWDEVDKMLAIGVIEESNSPWSNRTTVVRRPDKNRFCLDARKLNALTVKDAYPLPSIEGVEVADLQGSEFDPSEALGFQTNEFQSEEYQELVREVTENKESLPDLKVEGGAIFKRIMVNRLEEELDGSTWKLWVPASLTHELVRRAHEEHTAAHGGVAKTLHALRRQYFWPKMAVQVAEFVRDCELCKETKATNYRMQVAIGAEVVTERPFQKLYIDFLGKYPRSKRGHAWIFIVVDHFTKFTFLKAMRDATASCVVSFLVQEVFLKFGVPEVIHSDNGRQFTGKVFEEMTQAYGIHHLRTAVYSPQSNAAERVNRSVLAAIRAYLESDHREWDVYLPEIEVALRNSVHTATGVTPFFALFGQHLMLNGAQYALGRKLKSLCEHEFASLGRADRQRLIQEKIQKQLHAAYERSSLRYNERARELHLTPGQEVFRRNFSLSNFSKAYNAKFARKFLKARVVRSVGSNMYELEDEQGRPIGVFHSKDIRQ
ncbi:hypothetical protein ACLKA7_001583 [Drosophila subpalustris]